MFFVFFKNRRIWPPDNVFESKNNVFQVSGRDMLENATKITSKTKFSTHVVQISSHLHPALSYKLLIPQSHPHFCTPLGHNSDIKIRAERCPSQRKILENAIITKMFCEQGMNASLFIDYTLKKDEDVKYKRWPRRVTYMLHYKEFNNQENSLNPLICM